MLIEPALVKRLVGEHDVYRLRDELIPMISLADLLGIERNREALHDGLLVIVEADGRRVGLVVDEILGLQQVVVKSLEANFERVPGLAGATILGDGGVAFILDVSGIAKQARQGRPGQPAHAALHEASAAPAS